MNGKRQTLICTRGEPNNSTPCLYTPYTEPELTIELGRVANAKNIGPIHTVDFQPCPQSKTQDRHVIAHDWDGWTFLGVFDGHAMGHETVDYTSSYLLPLIRSTFFQHNNDPASLSSALENAIIAFDESIMNGFLNLLPSSEIEVSDEDLDSIIFEEGSDRKPKAEVARAFWGTTVLIALINPQKDNIWVVSLGDCVAVLTSRSSFDQIITKILSTEHNGENPDEARRIRAEHPGEDDCVLNERVLGLIAITRAIGDGYFKLATPLALRALKRILPEKQHPKFDVLITRLKTPPYLSSRPSVVSSQILRPSYLILCSDGLKELWENEVKDENVLSERWANILFTHDKGGNKALWLLKKVMGLSKGAAQNGGEVDRVSQLLSAEREKQWMDDVTIIVAEF